MREHTTISIADQIFEQLERDILTGKYQRGEVLSEMRLSAELGVSRTPIREALRRLEQENILSDSGRGAVVVGISREDMLDMYEMRIQIEGLAAQRAAACISEQQLQQMRETLELQRFYIEKPGSDHADQIKDLDSRFHQLLYESSGSKAFYETLSSMHKKMTKFRKASVSRHSRAVESLAEHEAIYEALSRHDGEAARELTKRHNINARNSMTRVEEKEEI